MLGVGEIYPWTRKEADEGAEEPRWDTKEHECGRPRPHETGFNTIPVTSVTSARFSVCSVSQASLVCPACRLVPEAAACHAHVGSQGTGTGRSVAGFNLTPLAR